MLHYKVLLRGGAEVARRAHNPKVEGSNPSPATSQGRSLGVWDFAPCSTHLRRRSSAVEQAAHNRRVTGSNPVAATQPHPARVGFFVPGRMFVQEKARP